jgi:diacylglycerol O-acyltransferase / wax synthase
MPNLLAPMDAMFLHLESPSMPAHVAGLQIFSLPEGAPADFMRGLVRDLRSTRDLAPPWNLKLKTSRLQGVLPSLVADRDVDMDYHVRHHALPQPGGERELGQLVSRLHSHRLNRRRPLWECHVIEGLGPQPDPESGKPLSGGRRFAIYTKIHHAIADGVTTIRLLTQSLGAEADARTPPFWAVAPGKPETAKTPGTDVATAIREQLRAAPKVARAVGKLAASAFGDSPDALTAPYAAPRSVLNVPITGERRFATQQFEIARLKAVGKAADATVNDVVLALCGAALRRFLKDANALPSRPLVAGVPVSIRPSGDVSGGNAVTMMLAAMGTEIADPRLRLETIRNTTVRGKAHLQRMPRAALSQYSGIVLAPFIAQLLSGLSGRTRPYFNVSVSNVPGPAKPLYLQGARMEAMYPVSNPFDGQALNITCTSYAGTLNFGFTGCRDALPHMQRLAIHAGEALAELEDAYGLAAVTAPAASTRRRAA